MQRNVLRYVLKVQNLFCHTPNRFRSRKSEQLKSTRPRTDTHFFNKMAKANENSIKPQIYDYFLVLDFEATCIEGKKIVPQEVIEFPVLKVNAKTFEIDSIFHQYVEPQVHKELTPFCTQLTGIIQEMVDGQPNINNTLTSFNEWMLKEGLLEPDVSSVFVTCGDWDLKIMLPSQSKYFQFQYPNYLNKWINIKKPYSDVIGNYPKSMMTMLEGFHMKHEGRHHSGIDDCRNLVNILRGIAQYGYVFQDTGSL